MPSLHNSIAHVLSLKKIRFGYVKEVLVMKRFKTQIERLIRGSMGEIKADLIVTGGKLVNVHFDGPHIRPAPIRSTA